MRGYFWRCIVLGTLGLTAAVLLALTPLGRVIDLKLGDALLGLSAPEADFSEVFVIDVDEPSMARLQPEIGAWPYNRDIYALVTPYLLNAGAKAVRATMRLRIRLTPEWCWPVRRCLLAARHTMPTTASGWPRVRARYELAGPTMGRFDAASGQIR